MTRFVSQLKDSDPNPKIINERRIADAHSYVGHLTQYHGIGWTHSLLSFGSDAFVSPDLAEADFWATKERLPQEVHKALFGYERRS